MTGWIVGDDGVILKTNDSGLTWESQSTQPPLTKNLRAVAALDANTAWAVGDDGTVLQTTDGKSWSRFALGIGKDPHLRGVAVVDDRLVWVVGDDGTVVKGTRGALFLELAAMALGSKQESQRGRGFQPRDRLGRGGRWTLLRTTDSGATWVPLNALDITKHFWGVAVIGDKVVWVVGDDGFIIKTENGGASWSVQRPRAGAAPGGKSLARSTQWTLPPLSLRATTARW